MGGPDLHALARPWMPLEILSPVVLPPLGTEGKELRQEVGEVGRPRDRYSLSRQGASSEQPRWTVGTTRAGLGCVPSTEPVPGTQGVLSKGPQGE